ncbi:MAG TPA: EAL domain-containing protein [Verrucomicrobiae bacterium]|nr:EAL domain-containing protein [Verrucomicrobiae bacterium]
MARPDRGNRVRRVRAIGLSNGGSTRIDALRRAGRGLVIGRIWGFTGLLGLIALVTYLLILAHLSSPRQPFGIPWPVFSLAFFLAELKVVDVHFRREKHSFSLSEFPAVLGLFLLSPTDYFLAMLVGSGSALLYFRQAPLKLAFNLSNFAISAAVTLTVFHLLSSPAGAPMVGDWVAAFAATFVATVVSAVMIATAISLSGGAPQFQKLPEMVQFGTLVAVANTSLALLAVSVLWLDPQLLWLLVVPLGTVFLAYRAYLSEREKGERLEFLYQSGRILQHSPELDSAIVALLEHARSMYRAERAEILLYPRAPDGDALLTTTTEDLPASTMVPVVISPDDPVQRRVRSEAHAFFHIPSVIENRGTGIRQAMVAPLRAEAGTIGSILIGNRLTQGTSFTEDDLRLLETLANQAAAALENGQLEQSLAELSRLKEELRHQAYHDPLTGLGNRSLFTEQVNSRIANPGPGLLPVVLFVDLDDFKVVNDSLGHVAGDRLLVAVADRVRNCVRSGDVAARLGGDEFAILLDDVADLNRALAVCKRLLEALKVPVPIEGQELSISASIGIAAGRDELDRADDLLRNADVAMYMAKSQGKSQYAIFEPTMHAAIIERHALSSELSRGVGRGELLVYYQPIVTLDTGRTHGVEALVRWRHPTRGIVGPDEFIPLAEESGTILALGRWVLTEACREVASWRGSWPGAEDLVLTINLSAAQLQQADFVDDLQGILDETGFPASMLVLELTETAMFHDTQTTIARLQALRALGIRIAIDDFGTGYSSLGYLRRFQVDILKIARDFVGSADGGSDDWAFAHAIVALGRTLDLRIVAEGVEQDGQLQRLRQMGCEFGQGFLFARPVDGPAFAAATFGSPGRPAAAAPLDGSTAAAPTANAPAIDAPGRPIPWIDLRTA